MSLILESLSSVRSVSAPQTAVVRTLLYFDIFKHPLTSGEIFQLNQQRGFTETDIDEAAHELVQKGIIQYQEGYYFLNNCNEFVQRRLQGEIAATKSLKTAKRFSRLMAKFPFVRAIAISGSLSKNYMDSESDIDYFIITAHGRMWVARTLLILFKKIFLLNSHKNFCVNYLITEDSLSVADRNIFTATEISFLIPTYDFGLYTRFREANAWSSAFLPNFPLRGNEHITGKINYPLKNFTEKIFSGFIGEKLDTWFFRITVKFWKKKFKHFDESTFDFRLRSKKNVSKHHPLGFQEKVLSKYATNITEFTRLHHISLHAEDPVYS